MRRIIVILLFVGLVYFFVTRCTVLGGVARGVAFSRESAKSAREIRGIGVKCREEIREFCSGADTVDSIESVFKCLEGHEEDLSDKCYDRFFGK